MVEPPWPKRVVLALKELPNCQGTAAEIIEIISERWNDLDEKKSAGKTSLRWHNAVYQALSSQECIQRTGKKIGLSNFWELKTGDDVNSPEFSYEIAEKMVADVLGDELDTRCQRWDECETKLLQDLLDYGASSMCLNFFAVRTVKCDL
jgi:hypothetical protein